MERRKFLKIVGGAAGLAGAGGYIWAAPTAKSARAPWRDARQYDDPMRFALSHAILAPNPHNRQPWVVDLVSKNEAVLYCDPERHLPVTDPLDRQITIGLGCFLELFTIAAQQKQRLSKITLFPLGAHDKRLDERPVARIKLTPGKVDDTGLFPHITNRRTDRTPYSGTVPTSVDMEAVQAAAGGLARVTAEPELTAAIRGICETAARIEFTTPRAHGETVDLMRVGRKAVKLNPDGINIEGPMIELLNLSGALGPDAMRDHGSTAFKQGMNMYLKAVDTAPSFLWIVTDGNTRQDQIYAGRAYARANLMATWKGLAMQPLSQALQEYPEMEAPLADIHEALNIDAPNRIQMLARVGYGSATSQSPKWPLDSRLK